MAREALTRRKAYLETATAMKEQIDQQQTIVTKLKENMRTLEAKLAEARTKKDMYIARARSAQASQRINEMIGQASNNNAIAAFERMEEKVNALEAQSDAIAELNADSLEDRFTALESGGSIEDELAAMRAELAPGSEPPNLPPGQA